MINNLRKIAQNVPDIKIQLDVFDEQRDSDEVQSLQDPDGINLNSHLDVFYAILRQVNKLLDKKTSQWIPDSRIENKYLLIDRGSVVSVPGG